MFPSGQPVQPRQQRHHRPTRDQTPWWRRSTLVAAPSEVSDERIAELRALGYRDGQITEVVGLVSLQLLTGAFNLVAGIHTTPTARSAT